MCWELYQFLRELQWQDKYHPHPQVVYDLVDGNTAHFPFTFYFQPDCKLCTVSWFSHSVMSDSLWPHRLQHAMLPCSSPAPRTCSSACPLSRWCHLNSLSSVIPFSCLQSFPESGSFPDSGSFPVSQFFVIRWPKYWSFSLSPPDEYLGLISFRMDWLDLLAVQGTLKSLLQHHSSKASILQCSAFFIVLLSHPYVTTGKSIPLTRWTFVSK